MSRNTFSFTVPARVALAGNPSDGHGGAVVATVVASLVATVTVAPSRRFTFDGWSTQFDSAGDVSAWVDRGGFDGAQPLMQAALAVLHRRFDVDLEPHDFAVSSTIPRSLGLAGSSAIVIAAMRALIAAHQDASWASALAERPELVASLALEAERGALGIAAGLQDRVVQTFGGTVAMEFGTRHLHTIEGLVVGTYRPLGPLPGGLFLAYRSGTAADSGLVHGGVDASDPAFRQAMAHAADAARAAAEAIDRSHAPALGEAMDATFDQRAAVFPLDPAHVEMIEVARANGASANYTGSGGSIVVLAPDDTARAALIRLGCTLVTV